MLNTEANFVSQLQGNPQDYQVLIGWEAESCDGAGESQ